MGPPVSAGSRPSAASSSGLRCRHRWAAGWAGWAVGCACGRCVGMLWRGGLFECNARCRVAAASWETIQLCPPANPAVLTAPLPQFVPGPPPYCMDSELPSSSSSLGGSSGCPSPASSVATQRRPNSASRRALEGAGVAAALRQDAAPAGGSFSGGYGAARGGGAPAAGVQRPSTAPAQRQYPWSWQD